MEKIAMELHTSHCTASTILYYRLGMRKMTVYPVLKFFSDEPVGKQRTVEAVHVEV